MKAEFSISVMVAAALLALSLPAHASNMDSRIDLAA